MVRDVSVVTSIVAVMIDVAKFSPSQHQNENRHFDDETPCQQSGDQHGEDDQFDDSKSNQSEY